MNPSNNSVSVFISLDEWRDITGWMHVSLDRTEQSVYGHFLLECEGSRRTWVASDGAQTTVIHGDGPPPLGVEVGASFSVLVNSRFFRRRDQHDATLTIRQVDDGRVQTLVTGGVEMTLPEHSADFGDWRTVTAAVTGTPVEIETALLLDACSAASVVPFGAESDDSAVFTLVSITNGMLRLESPWADFPWTTVDVPLLTDAATDTVPALVEIGRLINLLLAVDGDRTTLRLPMEEWLPLGVQSGRYEAVLMPTDRWGRERRLLEQQLCAFLGVESIEVDADGDYPVTTPEDHELWVRLRTDVSPVSVQVFSVLAAGVEPATGLFEELNSINAVATHAKVLWASGAVMAEVDLVAESLDQGELANALQVVRRTADRYHDVLSAYFGASADVPDADR